MKTASWRPYRWVWSWRILAGERERSGGGCNEVRREQKAKSMMILFEAGCWKAGKEQGLFWPSVDSSKPDVLLCSAQNYHNKSRNINKDEVRQQSNKLVKSASILKHSG